MPDIKVYLTGGDANSLTLGCKGGAKSSVELASQTLVPVTEIVDPNWTITILQVWGFPVVEDLAEYANGADFSLGLFNSKISIYSYHSATSGADVSTAGGTGEYEISHPDHDGKILLHYEDIGAFNVNNPFEVAQPAPIFRTVINNASELIRYACIAIEPQTTGTLSLYMPAETTDIEYDIGFSVEAKNLPVELISEHTDIPTGVVFTKPLVGSPLTLALTALDYKMLWIKQTIPANSKGAEHSVLNIDMSIV